MFIKLFRTVECFLLLLLVICFSFNTNVILESMKDGSKCSNTEFVSTNDTYDDEIHFKEWKDSNHLYSIIDEIISKQKAKLLHGEINYQMMSTDHSQSSENLSVEKQNVEILTTIMDADTTASVVTAFHTHSSSSSSQFDNSNKYDAVGEGSTIDLNGTLTQTFHSKLDSVADKVKEEETIKLRDKEAGDKIITVNSSIASPPIIDSAHEDIPSFREWAEKHLAEEEKEKGDENVTNVPSNGKSHKMRNKNYASLDCGAKLVATNPEANSAGSLLSMSRDEYLLSPCNSKIWFVVELCEAVQLKKIELANFELFSSSPKDFTVSISDRFPSRDWTVVGQFTAKDEKSIQGFNLQQHHFTKYIKVEFHSHYGKEHFCPVSLFRVYGTSEFEVLANVDGHESTENDVSENEDDVNEPIMPGEEGKSKKLETSKNLFGSARDAVINIVKKAAEVLVHAPSQNLSVFNETDSIVSDNRKIILKPRRCVTPRYKIVCHQCKECFFHRLYRTISCYMKELNAMLQLNVVWQPLIKYNVCSKFGISSFYLRDRAALLNANVSYFRANDFYIVHLLPREMLAALCNMMGISENRMKQNVTLAETQLVNQTLKKYDNISVAADSTYNSVFPVPGVANKSNESMPSIKIVDSASVPSQASDAESPASLIRPTKTSDSHSENGVSPSISSHPPNFVPPFPEIIDPGHVEVTANENADTSGEQNVEVEDAISLDTLISELENSEDSQPNSIQASTRKPPLQKESVFVRLANRIKALERNMSLSGQYLEELSRRYKKQVEDMQRVLLEASEDRQNSIKREAKLSQEVITLNRHVAELIVIVDSLVSERESWSHKALMVGEHSLILFLEIFIFLVIVCICRGIPRVEISRRKFSLEWHGPKKKLDRSESVSVKRTNSLDDLNANKILQQQKRRPSEEALKIDEKKNDPEDPQATDRHSIWFIRGRFQKGTVTPSDREEAPSQTLHEGHIKFEIPKVPVIFVIGGPGSGKVTHCDSLAKEKQGVVHINMTDLLHQSNDDNDGIKDSNLIPSRIVAEALMLEMKMSPAAKAFLISGYPRNMRDVVEYTDKIKTIDGVILLFWNQDSLARQIEFGIKLGHVKDDVAKMELKNFFKHVIPVADFFDQRKILTSINGERSPAEVYNDFRVAVLRIIGSQTVATSKTMTTVIPNGKIVSCQSESEEVLSGAISTSSARTTTATAPLHKPRATATTTVSVHKPPARGYPPVIYVIGGPGSNKGFLTQKVLRRIPSWTHICMSSLLRSKVDSKKWSLQRAQELRDTIAAGNLVQSEIVKETLDEAMLENINANGIVLDGFPRDLDQLRDFEEKYQQHPPIILLDCSKLQISRGRWDDSIVAFRKRLEVFREKTLPMLKVLDTEYRLTMVDGDTDRPEVQEAFTIGLFEAIQRVQQGLPGDASNRVNFETAILRDLEDEIPDARAPKHHHLNGYGPPRDKGATPRPRGANASSLSRRTPRQSSDAAVHSRANTKSETHAQIESYPK